MKLSTDKCSKYKIINSLNTLSVAGKITDGNKRGPLIFASDAIFTFSTRFVTRYCNKSYNFRKNRYFHSPRLEIISIQLSRLYQLSSLERKIKFSAFWKLNFSKQAATIVTLPFPRERSVRGPFDRSPIAPDDDVAQRFPTTSHG